MRRIRSPFLYIVLVGCATSSMVLAGCATSNPGDTDLLGGPQIRTVAAEEMGAGGDGAYRGTAMISYEEDPVIVQEVVGAPREDVWELLLEAYRFEGLEPDGADPELGLLTLSRIEWSRDRNGSPLSTLINCGPSATGRPLADDARIVASVAAQISEAETGQTRVAVRLESVAYPFDASSGNVRGCTSEGLLEQDIIAYIRAAATPKPTGTGIETVGPVAQPVTDSPFTRPSYEDFPVENGDQVRVWLEPTVRLTGSFMGLRQDTLLLRRSRRTALPVWSIEAVAVKRTRRSATVIGSIVGVAAGVVVAMNTDLGIVGDHQEQGQYLNPGLGGLVGGLIGAGAGTMFFGTTWEDIPLDRLMPGPTRPTGKDHFP